MQLRLDFAGMGRRVMNLLRRARPQQSRIYLGNSQAGVTVTEDTALTFDAVWACVSVISRTIAALPWRVFATSTTGREPVDGMVTWLLNSRPNPEMTAFTFRETLLGHVLTWGNGYAEIQRDLAGRPVALWPITPERVIVRRDETTRELFYQVYSEDGNARLSPSDVLHVHGMGFDGITGYSPIRMAARTIGRGIAQDTFGAAFYANGTVFGAIVEMPGGGAGGKTGRDQFEEVESYLNSGRQGPEKAFKVKVSPAGTKVHQLSMPLTDAQFIETEQITPTRIARWYGVPPHKIADLTRSTNNNIEHQGIEFVTDAIVPWCVRLEQEANVKLFGDRAQGKVYTKIMTNALMRGDAKSRADFYRTMVQIGAMSINEVRDLEELNSLGDVGDQHLVQLNQTTLEWLVENPGAKAEPAPEPEPRTRDGEMREGMQEDMGKPTNVIRATALEWMRQQRKQA